ncbi:hypothetical protein [Flagellimonas sp.]|uniref:hypothetical protein n=1 Tax=Flagellimonas sp. TaxID=2058762 RepID=UPI003BA8FC1F
MDGGINRCVALHYLYVLPNLNIVAQKATKKGNGDGSTGSKSKNGNDEIVQKQRIESGTKNKKGKRSRYNK